ncbi:MAG TPA: PIG-L family deacetylase [Candidatus Acidoferrum sp.]|nr:PIG-L family deacetylase [Candidatus Acidoferrum sp.]
MHSSFELTRLSVFDIFLLQKRTQRPQSNGTRGANRLSQLSLLSIFLAGFLAPITSAQAPKQILKADERYKVDILLVVAHPDDEGAATPYLARAIDEGKHVAVIYGTRGSSGENQAGAEQAAALGEIREIEARRALSLLGIDRVWFLGGKDTASQDVLQSLANWGHAETLETLVRLVRLTRPEVILTFLPGTFIGEDHGDHQAAGVLATEAFDLAGDAAVFPEQVAAPKRRLEPYLENLRPWQPKKIYYFADADKEEIFRGNGPSYSVKEISKSSKLPYWRAALESFRAHETQAKGFLDSLSGMNEAQIEKMATSDFWSNRISFVLGKSVAGGSVTGDIFEGITPDAINFARSNTSTEPPKPEISVELAGPWSFYAEFRRAHGLTHLPHPEPPEIALQAGTELVIPLWLENRTAAQREITLSVKLPAAWKLQSGTGKFLVAAKQYGAARIEINLPALSEPASHKAELQEIAIHAESKGQSIGDVGLHVELRKRALPE